MQNLRIAFCGLLAVSLGYELEMESPKELAASIFHPIEFVQSYLLERVDTLLADDGTNARNTLAEIDDTIDKAAEIINDITVTLEKKKVEMDTIPGCKFVNLHKGYEKFNVWQAEGDNMRNKYTPCVKNFKTQVGRHRKCESITAATRRNFKKLHNGLARCTKVDGDFGFLKSVMCTARLGLCVLWKTFTIPNQPLYVPVTHQLKLMDSELKSTGSCINADAPSREQFFDFKSRAITIVYDARTAH